MSSEHPQWLGGLPVLFFVEDPDEARRRADGARPAPASVRVPRIAGSGQPELEAVEYPLIQFPWEPWEKGQETQALAQACASWLNEIEPGRLGLIQLVLEQAGAPVGGLTGLGAWVQQWFPVLAAPLVEQGFLPDLPDYRLGNAWGLRNPATQGYSRYLDALVGSLAHDLAFIVADRARAVRPALIWQPYFDTDGQRFVVGMDPQPPLFDLVHQITDLLVQSAARARGTRGRELRHWYGLTLQRGYERAAHGTVLPGVFEAFPDLHSHRGYPRRSVSRPSRSEPPAPAELAEAVDSFRRAGWFETVKLSTPDLARAARAAWRLYEGEDIPLAAGEMHWRLLMLDSGRTWSEDADAAVRPGDRIYEATMREVAWICSKALRRLWSAEEDWASRPGDLLLSFGSGRGRHRLLIPSPGPYLSPALFTGLNDCLPADGPRLWFFDHGPPIAVVTRATAAERDALEQLTGLRLDPDPPPWWTSLAPLPDRQEAAPSQPAPPRRRTTTTGAAARRRDRSRPEPAPGSTPPGAPARRSAGASDGPGTGKAAGPSAATAQDAFAYLMRDLIAPALRELGFKGNWSRWLWYRRGDYEATFSTQKSRYSTREEVDFWVHLTAAHTPTRSVYWTETLAALIPRNDSFSWTIHADSPHEPVAEHLLTAFRGYGWPAIQAALDSPGYPPDPAVTWARTFLPEPSPAARGDTSPNMGSLTWPLRRTGQLDDLFADLSDPDEHVRHGAATEIGDQALSDPRAVPALLNHLEQDPSPAVRSMAARALRPLATQPQVRAAFQAAAEQDEDHQVRWAARYALRLADPARPSEDSTQ